MKSSTPSEPSFALAKLRAALRIIDSPVGPESRYLRHRRAWLKELSRIDPVLHLDAGEHEQYMAAIRTLAEITSDDQALDDAVGHLRKLADRLGLDAQGGSARP